MVNFFDDLSSEVDRCNGKAIIVVDANSDDQPIMYANPASEKLTGFGIRELVGENCRILQADDRDQPGSYEIGNALKERRPVCAVLRNYRKDGSLFYNRLFVDVVYSKDLTPKYFVGYLTEITSSDQCSFLESVRNCFGQLTAREKEVFRRVVSGFSSKAIASEFKISPRTVEKHRAAILKKFGISDTIFLVRYAVALGMPMLMPPENS